MTDTFVSLDVETTGPFPGMGELASIGATAVDGESLMRFREKLYVRLRPKSDYEPYLQARGLTEQQWMDSWEWASDTRQFWEAQDPKVRAEALAPGDDRVSRRGAADALLTWVKQLPGTPVFVAHPAGFDWAWINWLLLDSFLQPGMSVMEANPFGYRPMCLRALAWALGEGQAWNVDRATLPEFRHDPEIPHHPLYDAEAQGDTLVDVLRAIRAKAGQTHRVPEIDFSGHTDEELRRTVLSEDEVGVAVSRAADAELRRRRHEKR